jgi:hypothetical protein
MLQAKSVSQVARDLGIPRSTFYKKHLTQLREVFAANHMDDYMNPRPSCQFALPLRI